MRNRYFLILVMIAVPAVIVVFSLLLPSTPNGDLAGAQAGEPENQPIRQAETVEDFPSPILRHTHSGVNLRAGPGEDYDIVGSVPTGTALEAVGRRGEWYEIRINGAAAFVAGWLTHDAPRRRTKAIESCFPQSSIQRMFVRAGDRGQSDAYMRFAVILTEILGRYA